MKRMRVLGIILALVMMLGIVTSCGKQNAQPQPASGQGTGGQSQEPIKLSFAFSATPENALAIGYDKFAELVKEKSKGRLIIENHGSGSLAADVKAVEGVKLGTIDIASNASNNMSPFTKAFLFGDLPFIFKSVDSSRKVWDGPIGDRLKAQVEKDMNMKVLMFMNTGGFRQIGTTKKQVRTPADLVGLKLRATNSPVEIALLKGWGANPTPIAWPEVYTALQQGVVDGEHLHYLWMVDAKHHEVLKYITEINSMLNIHVVVMSLDKFNKLPKDLQDVLIQASKEAEVFEAQVDKQKQEEAKQAVIKAGVKIYVPTPDEMKLWKDPAIKVWDQVKDQVPPSMVQEVLDAQK